MNGDPFFNPCEFNIIEVYVYYDRPLLFSCDDRLGHIYLAVLVEEGDDGEKWLYVELSRTRFEYVRTGGMDLHDAYRRAENGYVYSVKYSSRGDYGGFESLRSNTLTEDMLPEKGRVLHAESKVITASLATRATQAVREIIDLDLKFPNLYQHEAPANRLSQIIASMQSVMSQIGMAIAAKPINMVVKPFMANSFLIEFETEKQIDVFGESVASDVTKKLFTLLSMGADLPNLSQELKSLPPQAVAAYLDLLKTLTDPVDQTIVEWASPKKGYGGKTFISSKVANDMITAIEMEGSTSVEVINIVGKLLGINLITHYYAVLSESDGKYTGHINEDIFLSDEVQNAQINRMYNCMIEKKTQLKITTGEPEISYHLMMLEQA
jgi:hypothetical protein